MASPPPSSPSPLATARPAAPDLRARRKGLEAEVAGLRREFARAAAQLESLRASGPQPRGFVWGLFAGLGLVAAGFLWFAWVVCAVGRPG